MERKGDKNPFHYDVMLEEYDVFDDYLEMVIQFGVRCKRSKLAYHVMEECNS